MTRLPWSIGALLPVLLFMLCGPLHAQFTQGPVGNPSGAGVITGTQPPAPAPPRLSSPPPSTTAPSSTPLMPGAPAASIHRGSEMITSPGWILSLYGMPALLTANEAGRRVLAQRLRLSPEQIERLERIREGFERRTRTTRYDLLQRRIEMQRLFSDPAANQAVLAAKQKEFGALLRDLMDETTKAATEARGLLRPEQIERLDAVMER